MTKKVFLILMLGEPFDWINQFVEHVQHLEKDGWYFKIFSPRYIPCWGNVEFIDMSADRFNLLVEKKLGILPDVQITERGIPSVHVTDFIVAHGAIFEDYTKGFDFWGHVGLDCVIGNLSKFIPDSELAESDVWTDDMNTINGNFLLVRNEEKFNNLFKEIPEWQSKLNLLPCPGCNEGGEHRLSGMDEYEMTEVMKRVAAEGRARYKFPPRFFIHSHDRLIQHFPKVHLTQDEDGTLWELFKDVNPPQWPHWHDAFAKEIAYFHFQRTKQWPL